LLYNAVENYPGIVTYCLICCVRIGEAMIG